MTDLQPGTRAPSFARSTDTGEEVSLDDLRGKPVVLYFYPKDDTPGCTRQACSIRDSWSQFERHGITLYGVSPDTSESHAKFREKYGLPFPLLADPDHSMAEDYGVWVEKTNYGKKYMGINRSAFVIDADGKVAAVKRGIKPEDTVRWALGEAEKLAGAAA